MPPVSKSLGASQETPNFLITEVSSASPAKSSMKCKYLSSCASLLGFFLGLRYGSWPFGESLRTVAGALRFDPAALTDCADWISRGVALGALCASGVPKSPEGGAPHHLRSPRAFFFGLRSAGPVALGGLPGFAKQVVDPWPGFLQ